MTIDLSEVDTIGKMREINDYWYGVTHSDALTAKERIVAMAEIVDKDVDELSTDDIAKLLDMLAVVSPALWRIWWSILPREKNTEGEQ